MPSISGLYPVKFGKIDTAASGATALVTGVASQLIRVVDLFVIVLTAVGIKFQSDSTDLTGVMTFAANGGMDSNSIKGLFETAEGETLNINLNAAIQVSGAFSYVLIPVSNLVSVGDLA